MAPVQMMSTNAVTDSASLFSTPVMIMTTVETSQMSLAAVSLGLLMIYLNLSCVVPDININKHKKLMFSDF